MRLLGHESHILQRTISVKKFVRCTNDDFSPNSVDSRKGCLIIWKLAPPNLIPDLLVLQGTEKFCSGTTR